jgi:purine catabolism regulator
LNTAQAKDIKELTFEALLQLPTMSEIKILSCQGSLHRPITGVTVMDTPHIGSWVRKGELILCSGYLLFNEPSAIVTLIDELSQKGAAGIGIKLHHWINDLPDEAIKLSEIRELPIIEIPTDWPWAKVIDYVLKAIAHKDTELLDLAQSFADHLMQSLKKGVSQNEMLADLATAIDRPVALCNNSFKDILIAAEPQNRPLTIKAREVNAVGTAVSYRHGKLVEIDAPTIPKKWSGLNVSLGQKPKKTALVVPVTTTYATLFLTVFEGEHDIPAQHIVMTSELADVLSVLAEYNANNFNQEKQDAFLFQFLNGEKRDNAEMELAARYYGWELRTPCSAFICEIDSTKKVDSLLFVKGALLEEVPHSIIGMKEKLFFGLVPLIGTGENNNTVHALQRANNKIKQQHVYISCSIVIGNAAFSLDEIPQSFFEARQALQISKLFIGPDRVVNIKAVAPYRLLLDIHNLPEVKQSIAMLFPAIEDSRNPIKTLKAFLASGSKIKTTANMLFCHRNTVRSHLSAIRDLTGFDPLKARDRFFLELYLYLYDIGNEQAMPGAAPNKLASTRSRP